MREVFGSEPDQAISGGYAALAAIAAEYCRGISCVFGIRGVSQLSHPLFTGPPVAPTEGNLACILRPIPLDRSGPPHSRRHAICFGIAAGGLFDPMER